MVPKKASPPRIKENKTSSIHSAKSAASQEVHIAKNIIENLRKKINQKLQEPQMASKAAMLIHLMLEENTPSKKR